MNRWKEFLDSLASRGGTILVLLLLVVIMGGFVMHILHSRESGPIATLVENTFAGFVAALTLALTGQRMANGTNGGAKPTPAAAAPPAAAPPAATPPAADWSKQ